MEAWEVCMAGSGWPKRACLHWHIQRDNCRDGSWVKGSSETITAGSEQFDYMLNYVFPHQCTQLFGFFLT